jgi:hypothetical protein
MNADPKVLSAAFVFVFRQGRPPPSCPAPNDNDLVNRILDTASDAPPTACRDALVRVHRLSFDVVVVCTAFNAGEYGTGDRANAAALSDLEKKDAGFTEPEYRTAFAAGVVWAGLG